ncbi:MAG: hypothetical protein CMJ78_09710 [Planctomycetaceae bacterium]|nr:hypothetical protein [Planctomycetaceae bacterium]
MPRDQQAAIGKPLSRRQALQLGSATACAIGLSSSQAVTADEERQSLKQRISELEKRFDGEFSIEVKRLDKPGYFELRKDVVRPTASTCKLFVLCELLRRAENGEIDLNSEITWKPEFHRGGDGVLRAMVPGQKLTIHNMAILMMMISDNIATATLVDLLGGENITRTIRSWGLESSNIHDGLPGGANYSKMKQPVSTASDMLSLITKIYRHEVLTPKSCDEIIRILRAQRCNDMLPRYIPVGEDWGSAKTWIANKTGYGACRVEVGIVKAQDVTFSLAMFFKPNGRVRLRTKCLADYPPVLAMAKACHAVYQRFLPSS